MNSRELNRALEFLGAYLSDQDLHYELVVIGGSALLLIGCIIRPTNDLDVVALIDQNVLISAQPLPESLLTATKEVAKALKLSKDWINPGSNRFTKNGTARRLSKPLKAPSIWWINGLLRKQD